MRMLRESVGVEGDGLEEVGRELMKTFETFGGACLTFLFWINSYSLVEEEWALVAVVWQIG